MSTVRLRGDIVGFGELLKKLGKTFPKAVVKAVREAGLRLGGEMIQEQIQATDPIPVDMGQYKASWRVRKNRDGCIVANTSKQGTAVEVGRKPGKMPPLDPLLFWAKRHGFQKWWVVAVSIQHKIGKHGIKGRRVLLNTIEKNKEELKDTIGASIRRQSGGL